MRKLGMEWWRPIFYTYTRSWPFVWSFFPFFLKTLSRPKPTDDRWPDSRLTVPADSVFEIAVVMVVDDDDDDVGHGCTSTYCTPICACIHTLYGQRAGSTFRLFLCPLPWSIAILVYRFGCFWFLSVACLSVYLCSSLTRVILFTLSCCRKDERGLLCWQRRGMIWHCLTLYVSLFSLPRSFSSHAAEQKKWAQT